MAGKLAIHIPPEANPDNVLQLTVALVREKAEFTSVVGLLDFADAVGAGSRTELQSMATSMGLIENSGDSLRISEQGQALTRIKEAARGDILHFLIYAGWAEEAPLEFLPSWAYRTFCTDLWEASTVELTSEYLAQQVTEVINCAETTFSELGVKQSSGISFSRKSLLGARRWLEALKPPVIENGRFERRAFCSPELLLLAIGFVMKDEPEAVDVDILLSHRRRDEICRVCLLEPSAFDQTLDWMIPLYPNVVVSTEEAGYYGRYIRLRKRPTLEDVVR